MKTIIVTGVSSGIGYGIAQEFIRKGYKVYGSVRQKKDGENLQRILGENYVPLFIDLTDRESIKNAAEYVKSKEDAIDGIINNAGSTHFGPLLHMSMEEFEEDFNVLLFGQLFVIQCFYPLLKQGQSKARPKIINITSTNAKLAFPFLGSYTAAKHALEGMSKSLRIELKKYDVDVVTIGPGIVKSAIWNKFPDKLLNKYSDTDYHDSLLYLKNSLFPEMVEKFGYNVSAFGKKVLRVFEAKKPKGSYFFVKQKFLNWTTPVYLVPNSLLTKTYAKISKII